MRRLLTVTLLTACMAVGLLAVDGPLTPLMLLRGRTDANGYLLVSAAAGTGSDGPLTALANLRGRTDAKSGVRSLLEVDLWEVSVVTFPMLPSARVVGVKAAEAGLATSMRRAAQMRNQRSPCSP